MSQPDLLYDEMTITIKQIYKTERNPKIRTINIKDTMGYEVFKRLLVDKYGDNDRYLASVEYMMKYILEILNDFETKNTMHQFRMGINDKYYNTGYPTSDVILTQVQQNNTESAANLAFVTNGRGFLKLENLDDSLSRIEISGSFLKILDLDPTTPYVFTEETSIPAKLNFSGHDYIVLRCNQCKNTLDNLKIESLPQFSNVLSIIPTPGTGYIRYDVPHTGNKIMMHGRTLDSINLMFNDKWGQPLYGIQDFYIEITVDFLKVKDIRPSVPTFQIK